MGNNYLTEDRDEWLASKKGKMSASEIYRLFAKGSRPMTQAEMDARPKYIKKDGTEGRVLGAATVETLFGDGAINYIREKIDELITINNGGDDTNGVSQTEWKQTLWGNSNEFDGLRHFEVVTGKSIIFYGGGSPIFYPYGDYCGCSPDADVVGEDALVEMKCPYNTDVHTRRLLYKTFQEFKDSEFKDWNQCQCQMKILNKNFCYWCSYDPRKSLVHQRMKIVKIQADLDWQSEFDTRIAAAILLMREMLMDSEKYLILEQ